MSEAIAALEYFMTNNELLDDELTKRIQGYGSRNKALAFIMVDDIEVEGDTIPGWNELVFDDVTILV